MHKNRQAARSGSTIQRNSLNDGTLAERSVATMPLNESTAGYTKKFNLSVICHICLPFSSTESII